MSGSGQNDELQGNHARVDLQTLRSSSEPAGRKKQLLAYKSPISGSYLSLCSWRFEVPYPAKPLLHVSAR